MQNIQWYPGHMTKTKRMLLSQMSLIDVVVELLDARLPLSSRNPDIDTIAKDKKRVLVLNKADLANPEITALWEEYFAARGFFTLALNAKDNNKNGINKLTAILKKIMQPKIEQQKKRGRINAPIRAMIVGIPNVGKSTFINRLAGRASTAVADKPGVTRGRQWIKVANEFDLLDTPGVLWPKFDDKHVGLKLACTGAISDNVLDKTEIALYLLHTLAQIAPTAIETRYKVQTAIPQSSTSQYSEIQGNLAQPDDAPLTPQQTAHALQILESIGTARGFKIKGGKIDIERTAIILLDEFRGGKLGRITLEKPD